MAVAMLKCLRNYSTNLYLAQMNKFFFTGDWVSSIHLELFDTYSTRAYTGAGIKVEQKRGNEIKLCIADVYGDMDPDPKPAQINTINYLLDPINQKEIILSVIRYLHETVYPYYQQYVFSKEEYPNAYPNVSAIEDFHKYFRLYSIDIYALAKGDHAYFCMYFKTDLLDNEHGFSVEMHRDRCIDHGTNDGPEGAALAKELNLPKNTREAAHALMDDEKAILYEPHPKYGKIKPWQEDANRRYDYNAYKTHEDQLLMNYVKQGHRPISQYKHMYDMAIRDGRQTLIEFFKQFDELNQFLR